VSSHSQLVIGDVLRYYFGFIFHVHLVLIYHSVKLRNMNPLLYVCFSIMLCDFLGIDVFVF
jgi:hypothetical protein